jgi:hypothetical protein
MEFKIEDLTIKVSRPGSITGSAPERVEMVHRPTGISITKTGYPCIKHKDKQAMVDYIKQRVENES